MSFESIFESPTITRDYDTEKLIRYESWSPSLQARLKKIEDSIGKHQTNVGERINAIKLTFSDYPPPTPTNNMDMWIDTKYRALRVYAEKNWEFTRCSWYVGTNPQIYTPVTDDEPNPGTGVASNPKPHTEVITKYKLIEKHGDYDITPSSLMTFGTDAKIDIRVSGASTISVNSNRQLGCFVLIYWKMGSSKEYASVKQFEILGNGNASWPLPSGYSFICEIDTNFYYMKHIHAVNFDPTINIDKYSGATYVGAPFKYQYTKAAIDAVDANTAPAETSRDYARGKFELEVKFTQTY